MVMAAFTMDMPMGNFFGAGITHIDNLDLEMQALTGQRMIAIDSYFIAVQITDGDNLHTAVRT